MTMEQRRIGDLTLFFDVAESETAGLVEEASRRSIRVIGEAWGLPAPSDCRVVVMTSWFGFLFGSAPWPWRVLMVASFPIWSYRVHRMWPYAAGCMQRFGNRRAVGIKPTRLIEASDKSIGRLINVREDDLAEKVRQVTCHELMHAFTAHLRLPSWLNEGLAMVTVDRFAGKTTVREDTLEALGQDTAPKRPLQGTRFNPADKPAIVRHYVRGYWIARLLTEVDVMSMRELLRSRRTRRELERRISAILGLRPEALWRQVDGIVLAHFGPNRPPR
jgi:hypothetical protein